MDFERSTGMTDQIAPAKAMQISPHAQECALMSLPPLTSFVQLFRPASRLPVWPSAKVTCRGTRSEGSALRFASPALKKQQRGCLP
jgi:hypothetical protein